MTGSTGRAAGVPLGQYRIDFEAVQFLQAAGGVGRRISDRPEEIKP